jgi:hypothetical protein
VSLTGHMEVNDLRETVERQRARIEELEKEKLVGRASVIDRLNARVSVLIKMVDNRDAKIGILQQSATARALLSKGGNVSNPKYIQTGIDKCLAHVIEECGELIQACAKAQRWGFLSVNQELPKAEQKTNLAWMREEWNDVWNAINRLEAEIDKDPELSG